MPCCTAEGLANLAFVVVVLVLRVTIVGTSLAKAKCEDDRNMALGKDTRLVKLITGDAGSLGMPSDGVRD